MALCHEVEVPMNENEKFMKTMRNVIEDTLYTHHVELQQKNITKWNQKKKKKMDIPASIKQKDHPKVRKGAHGDIYVKLDRMIRWMQETGPVLQEFTWMNVLRTPSYPQICSARL